MAACSPAPHLPSTDPTSPSPRGGALQVRESGRALKVQHTEVPHLVSLGGGRLSTAVTLHPLPEGRVVLGSGEGVDIVVEGTGVEPRHCIVENAAGVVTLTSLAQMTSLDGLQVSATTRLTQGSMVCIGRSNYFRFNHPAEARLMKSMLPNSRISMLPIGFYPGMDNPDYFNLPHGSSPGSGPTKPPVAPRGVSRPAGRGDSWSEDAWLGMVSPKVFHADTVTVNSPASAVLGPRAASSPSPLLGPGFLQKSSSPSPLLGGSSSPAHRRTLSAGSSGSGSRVSQQHGRSSPLLAHSPPVHGAAPGISCSPAPSLRSHGGSSCSLEELVARGEELEFKRKKAQEARLREQEAQREERARLEEILSMCAEYERQAQHDKKQQQQQQQQQASTAASTAAPGTTVTTVTTSSSAATTPVHQNRIKTNGSLPRDKRLPSPSGQPTRLQPPASPAPDAAAVSPVAPRSGHSSNRSLTASEDELSQIFTFDSSSPLNIAAPRKEQHSGSSPQPRSPYENVAASTSPSYLTYPQSPRTRIRTIAASKERNKDSSDIAASTAMEGNSSVPPPKPPLPSPRIISVSDIMTSSTSADSPHLPVLKALEAQHRANSSDRFIRPLGTSDGSLEPHLRPSTGSLPNSPLPHTPGGLDAIARRRSGEELEQMRRERSRLLSSMSSVKRKVAEIQLHEEEVVRELEMERALLDGEWQAQREKLAQEEERLLSLRLRLEQLDRDVATARHCEARHLGECRARLEAGETEAHRLEQELMMSRGSLEHQHEISEQLRHQQEVLEVERKTFEDQEFNHMEQEAMWEAGREELTRELGELAARIQGRQARLMELQNQRREATEAALNETHLVERQLDTPLRRLAEGRNRLREIEGQLQEMARQGLVISHDSSPDGSSDADESSPQLSLSPQHLQHEQRQQEDLERISRITSKAPIDMRNGSLNRKTIESLKEIEKNRHVLLAKQGREVIEEERKRVQALKRRVQDEVRAQWEERRQREANCNSLNSVGSEESSLTSSDAPTESASSDDAVEKSSRPTSGKSTGVGGAELVVPAPAPSKEPSPAPNSPSPVSSNESKSSSSAAQSEQQQKMRQQELQLERDLEECRPLSDGSSYDDQLSVRLRDPTSKLARGQQQRPLTRYLPIRSEALDLHAHIESAGHQVELCTHVIINSTSCRGYLHKMGSKFRTWHRRWFVFDRTRRCLTYYADRSEKKARGGAYFQSIEEVYVDHLNSVKSPNPQLTFCVKATERTYHLMAPSAEAMRIWVDVLFTGAEGYQEFEPGS